ncbi:MAG: polymerase subunit epsilon [Thermomicrobiales bacterium]|nr:polymerase subunit epsilon [Thermomicrobiales bacterium]
MGRTRAQVDSQLDAPLPSTSDENAGDSRYAFLTQRALEFIRSQSGAVEEDRLIAHVFGSGSPTLWQSLLRQVLNADGSLVLRADGCWAIPGTQTDHLNGDDLLGEFVAVDVETTGLRPLQQRIIEIAAVRYRQGIEIARLESLLQPERRIPAFITKLTGISDDMVAEAPRFVDLADAVVEFIGDAPILGHNVGFDVGFLNGELKRLGRPQLINNRIDVMGLAMRLLPELRRPSLDKVALAVGLNPRHVHRAGVDAELAAQSALRLAAKARAAGHSSAERIRALSMPPERRAKDDVGRGRAVLDRSLLADIPKKPGVYIMRDAFDKIIYVGKAKNLRDRVSSYYSQPLGYRRKMDGLLESLVQIDVEVTGCELEALLLESQLIRRYQPRYNTAMRSHEEYPFIRVDLGNPWPRVTLAKSRKEDGARYFGPFKNKNAARSAVDLINSHFPLRTCPRSFKTARSFGAPCIQLDLGRCLGPCVGRADRDAYMLIVRQVIRFLEGEDDVLYQEIWRGLEDAAARLDFERARRLRNDLRQLQQVVSTQRSLREATERHTLLLVLPSAIADHVEVMLVVRGRPWAQLRVARSDAIEHVAGRLDQSWTRLEATGALPIDHDSVDEAHILNRWLARNWNHPAVVPLTSLESPDWSALARQTLSLTDAALTRPTVDVEEESESVPDLANEDSAPLGSASPVTIEHAHPLAVPPIGEIVADASP